MNDIPPKRGSDDKTSTEITRLLQDIDSWEFDIFSLDIASHGKPLKIIVFSLFARYGLMKRFRIVSTVLDKCISLIEQGSDRNRCPYTNNVHAANVVQAMHYMIISTGLGNWMGSLEKFAVLCAAMIHVYNRQGYGNGFHFITQSDLALTYNDRSMNENQSISGFYTILKDEESNILAKLSKTEYYDFRDIVIELVLASDYAYHFDLLNILKTHSNSFPVGRSKLLAAIFHCCDVSDSGKPEDIYQQWVSMQMEQFFIQGDKERELELPITPFFDRNQPQIAQCQIQFIDFIALPSMALCSEVLEFINPAKAEQDGSEYEIPTPWLTYSSQNREKFAQEIQVSEDIQEEPPTEETNS